MATAPRAENGKISSSSYMSIGLVGAVVASVIWVTTTVSGMERSILPRLSSIDTRIEGIAEGFTVMRVQMNRFLTANEVQGLIDKAFREDHTAAEVRHRDVEARLRVIESNVTDERK